jgi:hypothetical protein
MNDLEARVAAVLLMRIRQMCSETIGGKCENVFN